MVEVKELPERPRPGEEVQLPSGRVVRVRHVGIPWVLPPKRVCDDPECPWHGHLKVRGVVFEGVVEGVYGKTAVVVHEWLKYDAKYKRYERRRRKIHVRVPPCIEVRPGDRVIVGETRPLAKSVRHVVIGRDEDRVEYKSRIIRLEGSGA
ncbi:30S ribosomal protein S17 [Vulcanisaeta thermophila]|uniref:30S ribosomal protein S17 n=1 Tax=Vulcanisaeta thermophila TaxID=867917 RepID=UPI000A036962|nr:30S ribosomal protein S17 [Vulcanisaeta thermophila]